MYILLEEDYLDQLEFGFEVQWHTLFVYEKLYCLGQECICTFQYFSSLNTALHTMFKPLVNLGDIRIMNYIRNIDICTRTVYPEEYLSRNGQ